MVKHHGENSQSAQAIELGQIGPSFTCDCWWGFFFGGHHLHQTQQRRLIHVKVWSAQRQNSYHASSAGS